MPTGETAEPPATALLLEAWVVALPVGSAAVSDSDAVFVHCRAFFYREQIAPITAGPSSKKKQNNALK